MNDLLLKIALQPLLAWVPGWMEMAIVLVVVMLLFGNRLPSTMRSLGQSLVQFKKGMKEGDEEGSDKLH
jgi:sec-independent protein translocase protein TatA